MSKIKIQGNASGTGVVTLTAPNTNTDRTITLPDSTGSILMTDGDGSSLTNIERGLQSVQTFGVNGTWTKPAGVSKIKVTCIGAGGGGGSQGTGGGGGGTSIIFLLDVTAITSEVVTIGAGGSGAGGTGSGTAGATSSFGAHCSATGGQGGFGGTTTTQDPAQGGVGSGGNLNLGGNSGSQLRGGSGGASYLGGGSGTYGSAPGAGASGGNSGIQSFSGNAGIVIIEEYK